MSQEPIPLLLIGCGGISRSHLQAFDLFPDRLRLVAACDPSTEATQSVADRLSAFGEVHQYDDLSAMLKAESTHAQGAIITTPHHLHYPQTLACLEAKLSVLVEKPATNSLEEAVSLFEVSQKRNVQVVVGQTRRYDREMVWLKQWIHSDPKHIGMLRSFEMSGWQDIEGLVAAVPSFDTSFWLFDGELAGGGVLISLQIHYIDLIRFLFETNYDQVSALAREDPPFRHGAESVSAAMLTTTDGAFGTLHANYLTRGAPYCESFKALGEYGTVGTHATTLDDYAGSIFYCSNGGVPQPSLSGGTPEFIPQEAMESDLHESAFVNQMLAFADTLSSDQPSVSGLEDNLNTLAVVDALYRSIKAKGALTRVNNF